MGGRWGRCEGRNVCGMFTGASSGMHYEWNQQVIKLAPVLTGGLRGMVIYALHAVMGGVYRFGCVEL